MIKSYIKQLQNHDCAHAYMLAASDAVLIFFRDLGFLAELDFSLHSFYDCQMVCMTFEAEDLQLVDMFAGFITKYEIAAKTLEKYTKRAAIRLLGKAKIDHTELDCIARQINNTDWTPLEKVRIQKTSSKTKNKTIKIYKSKKQKYKEIGIMVGVKGCPEKLRGLAVIVVDRYVEILWQIACDKVDTTIGIDNDWKKGELMIANMIVWRSYAEKQDTDIIYDVISSIKKELAKCNFAAKIVQLILRNLDTPAKIFDESNLALYSGVVTGRDGWREIATKDNVQKILDAMIIETVVELRQ